MIIEFMFFLLFSVFILVLSDMNGDQGMRTGRKTKQKVSGDCPNRAMASANKRSCHRRFFSHVPCYRTVSKHYLRRMARFFRDLC